MTSEKELKIIKTLREINISRSEAKTLFYLFRVNEGLAIDIERGAELRQPELSSAAKSLLERGWIKSTSIESTGKGRPRLKYSFAMPKNDIFKAINKLFLAKIQSSENDMKVFDEIMKVT